MTTHPKLPLPDLPEPTTDDIPVDPSTWPTLPPPPVPNLGSSLDYFLQGNRRNATPAMICFSGDRHQADTEEARFRIRHFLREVRSHHAPVIVIHGDCRGVDRIAGAVAKEMRLPVRPFPSLAQYGRAGGPTRNAQMVAELVKFRMQGGTALVAILHDHLEDSTGTVDLINQATAAELEIRHVL